MVATSEIEELLDSLAQRFEDSTQTMEGVPDASGWGQFLDLPKRYKQIGPYGTAAGIIVLTLAGREQSILTRHATTLLCHWWRHRQEDSYIVPRIAQTLRLAFFNLALRLSDAPGIDEIRAEVAQELIKHLLPNKRWGDFWTSERLFSPFAISFRSFVNF